MGRNLFWFFGLFPNICCIVEWKVQYLMISCSGGKYKVAWKWQNVPKYSTWVHVLRHFHYWQPPQDCDSLYHRSTITSLPLPPSAALLILSMRCWSHPAHLMGDDGDTFHWPAPSWHLTVVSLFQEKGHGELQYDCVTKHAVTQKNIRTL